MFTCRFTCRSLIPTWTPTKTITQGAVDLILICLLKVLNVSPKTLNSNKPKSNTKHFPDHLFTTRFSWSIKVIMYHQWKLILRSFDLIFSHYLDKKKFLVLICILQVLYILNHNRLPFLFLHKLCVSINIKYKVIYLWLSLHIIIFFIFSFWMMWFCIICSFISYFN